MIPFQSLSFFVPQTACLAKYQYPWTSAVLYERYFVLNVYTSAIVVT